ncbi:hypothetical protein F8M41_004494 [Gigaspora margarita]|uniref:Uncharacterized protein n=1 Tax=Gigaspora margarita TaxID=4874 RepID=A0A8H3XCM4_GIGMA|nr:hypothetical protein F8M41_004494 [Gigaspora margarita]
MFAALVTTYLSHSKLISYNQHNYHPTYSLSITKNNTYNNELSDSSGSLKNIVSIHNIFSKMPWSRAISETDEPEPASQSSSAINYSQDEVNDLFGINY